jgi:hypothetical protein
MKYLLTLILGLLIGAAAFWLLSHHEHAEAEPKAAEEAHHEAGILHLTKEQREAAGIQVAAPVAVQMPDQIKAYGKALDASAIIGLQLDVETARAAFELSQKDFERVKALHNQNQNASQRAYELAESTFKRDQIQLNLAEVKLQTILGPSFAQRADLLEIIDGLAKMKFALIRFDVVSGALDPMPQKFQIAPLADEAAHAEAELLGPAPLSDPSIQGRGYLAIVRTNPPPPNTMLVAWLENPKHSTDGFVVPSSAVLQEGPDSIVFVETGADTFRKIAVEADERPFKGIFIKEGLAATNRVVIEGAHQLLSMTRTEAAE